MSADVAWETSSILVVDDQPMMRQLIVSICDRLGYTDVYVAETGEQALKFMRQQKLWFVLCDWNMRPMSGLDLLRAVRSDEELRDTKFVMMTTEGNVNAVVAAKRAGVDGYLLKPFSPQTLADTIARMR